MDIVFGRCDTANYLKYDIGQRDDGGHGGKVLVLSVIRGGTSSLRLCRNVVSVNKSPRLLSEDAGGGARESWSRFGVEGLHVRVI